MQKNKEKKLAQISEDKLTVEYDLDEFSETLPHLSQEIQSPPENVPEIIIDGVKHSNKPDDPRIIDFLQRCQTDSEAEEIIQFQYSQREITDQEKADLLQQLRKEGVRSFGPLKTFGYYERTFRRK